MESRSPGIKTVLVCEARVPLVEGGAELCVRGLVRELQRHGYVAEAVSIPFKWYPKDALLAQAAAWRLIDLSESNGRPIDLVIATKFPTYFVRHPNKVTWLFHQYRAIYELCGTPYSEFHHEEGDVALRETLVRLDGESLRESTRLFTIARNVTTRLHRYNGLNAEPLYHPPPLATELKPGPFGDYVLAVGRLETIKRTELIIQALRSVDPTVRLIIVGTGPLALRLAETAAALDLSNRVIFLGAVDDRRLVELYAGALAVIYPPYDEDYGYVTLEAFLAGKPVVTTVDAGGPLEFVVDGENGLVTAPEPEAIGRAIVSLAADRQLAARLGSHGRKRAEAITWAGVIERLVGAEGHGR